MSNPPEPERLTFDATDPNRLDVVRQAFLSRLRSEPNFSQIIAYGDEFRRYVEISRQRDKDDFKRLLVDAYWSLVLDGVIAPGTENGNPEPPFFHLTDYGRKLLAEPDYQPHDPAEYLRQMGQSVPTPNATVLAYLKESLDCYARRMIVASTMMLGIAAERVFLLVCESLLHSLADPTEKADFQKIVDRNAMKPKLDWLTEKLKDIQTPRRPADLPEDVDIKIPGIYNLIRCQRNDVGHPRVSPPIATRDDAYGYLRIFPSYYATAESVREFLANNHV